MKLQTIVVTLALALGAPVLAQDEEPEPQETKTAFKANISADAYLAPATPGNSEGKSNRKARKVKLKTSDFIEGILAAEGIEGVNPRQCKLLACFNGDLEVGEIDYEDIDWFIYCPQADLTLALDDDEVEEPDDSEEPVENPVPPGQEPEDPEEADDEFRVISTGKAKKNGSQIRSNFTFWEWDFELEGLSIVAVTQGTAKVTIKEGEFQNVTFKADGFHNINIDGEEGLGKIRIQIAGSEKNFVPPVEEEPVEEGSGEEVPQ